MDRRDYMSRYGRMDFPEGFYIDIKRMIVYFNLPEEEDSEESASDVEDVEVDGKTFKYSLPMKREVCGTCSGKGTHVNPSIDSHGLTQEDFAEDPDFREDYLSGKYDVECYECHGRTTVPEIALEENNTSNETWNLLKKWRKDEYDSCATDRAEARYFAMFER